MGAIPDITQDRENLSQIDGAMPRLNAIPTGCAFNPRCERVIDKCRQDRPDLVTLNAASGATGASQVACWLHAGDVTVPQKVSA